MTTSPSNEEINLTVSKVLHSEGRLGSVYFDWAVDISAAFALIENLNSFFISKDTFVFKNKSYNVVLSCYRKFY